MKLTFHIHAGITSRAYASILDIPEVEAQEMFQEMLRDNIISISMESVTYQIRRVWQ